MPSAVRTALPGYAWDPRMGSGRYRVLKADGSLGRLVSQQQIVNELRVLHERSALQLGRLARLAVAGDISPATFQITMMQELKSLHNASAALANGGWSNVSKSTWGRNGRILRDEYRALAGFARDIDRGIITADAAADRAALYTDNAYGRYWDESQRRARDTFSRQRIVTAQDEKVCSICQAAEQQGWTPIGANNVPLHLRCRCHIEYEGDSQ